MKPGAMRTSLGFVYRLCFIDIEIYGFQELLGDIPCVKIDTGAFEFAAYIVQKLLLVRSKSITRAEIYYHVDILMTSPMRLNRARILLFG